MANKIGRPKKAENKLITRATSIDNLNLLDNLPDPDRVLEKLGYDPDLAYRDIMADDHLTSVMGTCKAAIKGMEWDLTAGEADDRILNATQDMLDGINQNHQGIGIARFLDDTLEAVGWGMSVCEVVWRRGPTEWTPVEVKGRPFRYFTFINNNELRFLTKENSYNGVELPPHRALLARHWVTNGSFDNPYGDKLLSKSYWPVTFKRNAMQWCNVFLEKYGMPWPVGYVPAAMDQNHRDEFADALSNMVQDGILVTDDRNKIELLEKSNSGTSSSNSYIEIMNYMDKALSKIWLGQTLTTDVGDVGSYAASITHRGVKDERTAQHKLMCY